MTPELWQRLKPLYDRALDAPEEGRAQFVAEACGDDPQMLEQLHELLAATEENGGPLDQQVAFIGQISAASPEALPTGELVEGRFRILRRLGSGGMGDVYEAEDILLRQGRIALKAIRREIAGEPGVLARFKEEVVLARRISGPNVCRIYELYVPASSSKDTDGVGAFLTMEYLEGETLADRITQTGPMTVSDALRIAVELCAALETIHAAGVIHRDLKPRNIMLVPNEQAKQPGVPSERLVVMDFGLARAFHVPSPSAETALTVPGAVMGTPAYMAPEQFEGGEITPATDVYALGVVLYEVLTGKRPFAAPSPLGAVVRRSRPPTAPSAIRSSIPAVWDDVIARCLEYEPERRYQSPAEVVAALRQHSLVLWRFRQGQRVALTPRSGGVAAAVFVAAFAMTAWLFFRARQTYQPAPTVAHWYELGLTALREGTYLKATNALGMATKLDNDFSLAHARLADAWSELDSTANAQREMLIASAPGREQSLSELDRRYVDAVRSTLVRDYSAAAQDYEAILSQLPEDQKAEGYVDLGRAYEKAGRIAETLASYEEAARRRPDDPAPFVHLGIWKSRQRDPAGAEADFSHAEMLYGASSNLEGRAEVAYQRGYAANLEARDEAARKYLNESLDLARQIKSVQLQARALSQLSNLADAESKEDQAIELADQALQLARDNNIEYWSTDALMRLANAYLGKTELDKAESYAQQTLALALQNQHPRLEAAANFTLSSIRDQQGKPDEQIAFAEKALPYYRDFGFMSQAAASSQLIIRGQKRKGEFKQAQEAALQQLSLAQRTNSTPSIKDAEETVGGIALTLEDYPTALTHFQAALKAAQSVHEGEAYQQLHCANALWRLGRYQEASEMLAAIMPEARKVPNLALGIQLAQAEMLLSQLRSREALKVATKTVQDFPGMRLDMAAAVRSIVALSELQLGQLHQAQSEAEQLLTSAKTRADPAAVAEAELLMGQVYVSARLPEKAQLLLQDAAMYYSDRDQTESEWLSFANFAKAEELTGGLQKCGDSANKSLDILEKVQQSWGSPVFQKYAARPDYQVIIRQLSACKSLQKDSHHDRAQTKKSAVREYRLGPVRNFARWGRC